MPLRTMTTFKTLFCSDIFTHCLNESELEVDSKGEP